MCELTAKSPMSLLSAELIATDELVVSVGGVEVVSVVLADDGTVTVLPVPEVTGSVKVG